MQKVNEAKCKEEKKTMNKGKASNYKGGSKNKRSSNFNNKYKKQEKDHNTCAGNDPSWYAANPALLRDSASIPFSWAVGTPISLDIPNMKSPWSIPGIMTVDIIPSFGYSSDPNSPLNLAATSMYSFIRHANSGHANYDSPDLVLYIGAMTQIYSAINWLQRIYGCVTLYAQGNRYLPTALTEAQFVDYNDVYNNLANFRYGINALIAKCSSLAVPATMPIFNRHAFLFQNVYIEGPSIKDQMYMFNPAGFYWFDFDQASAGCLVYHQLQDDVTTTPKYYTSSELLSFVNAMLDSIVRNEDINIMSGDILKAYGGNIIKLAPLPEIYPLVPVFNAAVLEQLKNATVFDSNDLHTLDIKQSDDKSFLEYMPTYIAAERGTTTLEQAKSLMDYYFGRRVLSTIIADPDPSVVMEDTRLMVALNPIGRTDVTASVICGSEIPVDIRYFTLLFNSSGNGKLSIGRVYSSLSVTAEKMPVRFSAFARLKHFKYCPAICATIFGTESITREIYFDADNFAVLDYQTLNKMHETAILSMLNVASVAKV